MREVYQLLKQIGMRDLKGGPRSDYFTPEEFKEHFEKVSENRHENDRETRNSVFNNITDRRSSGTQEACERLEMTISDEKWNQK